MTAEQLEELASGFATHLHSEETIQSLARRVLAAEKLVEAIYDDASDQWWTNVNKAATAYREASK